MLTSKMPLSFCGSSQHDRLKRATTTYAKEWDKTATIEEARSGIRKLAPHFLERSHFLSGNGFCPSGSLHHISE
jgi:hypothetical protein